MSLGGAHRPLLKGLETDVVVKSDTAKFILDSRYSCCPKLVMVVDEDEDEEHEHTQDAHSFRRSGDATRRREDGSDRFAKQIFDCRDWLPGLVLVPFTACVLAFRHLLHRPLFKIVILTTCGNW